MKKKTVLLGLAGLAAIAGLTACGDDKPTESEYVNPYEIMIAKPMLISQDNNQFTWAPVSGAAGYIAKVDGNDPVGIGNPILESDGQKVCYYNQSVDSLSAGKHTISFAAYVDDKVSKWTDAFEFTVEAKTAYVARPKLYSTLLVSSSESFDSITYDFGNGITFTENINSFNSYGDYSYTLSAERLASKLTDGKTYIVTAKITKDGITSEASNNIVFKYNLAYNKKAPTPVYGSQGEFYLDEAVYNPIVVTKVNNVEYYTYLVGQKSSIDVSDILEKIVLEDKDAPLNIFATNDVKIAIKILSDDKHYQSSNYSDEMLYEITESDEEIFDDVIEKIEFDVLNEEKKVQFEAVAPYRNPFAAFVSVEAKADDASTPLNLTRYMDDGKEFYTYSFLYGNSSVIHVTFNYKRGSVELSKTFDCVIPKASEKVKNVIFDSNSISWDSVPYALGYVVEISDGTNNVTKNVEGNTLGLDSIDLSGNLSFKVYPSDASGNKIEQYGSEAVSVLRKSPLDKLEIDTKNCVSLKKGYKYTFVNSNGNTEVYDTTNSNISSVSITGYGFTFVSVVALGDNVNTISSKPAEFDLTPSRNAVEYNIVDHKYIEFVDLDASKLSTINYTNYWEQKEEKTLFNVEKYHNDYLNNGARFISYPSEVNSVESGLANDIVNTWINFKFAPNVIVSSDYTRNTSSLEYYGDNNFDGTYEITVSSLDSSTNEYTKLETKTTTEKSLDLSAYTSGKYKIEIKTLGNGYFFNGAVKTVYYVANSDFITNVKLSNYYYSIYTLASLYDISSNDYASYYINGSRFYDDSYSVTNNSSLQIRIANGSPNYFYKNIESKTYTVARLSLSGTNYSNVYAYKVGDFNTEIPQFINNSNILTYKYDTENGRSIYYTTSNVSNPLITIKQLELENVSVNDFNTSFIGNNYGSIYAVCVNESNNLYDYLNNNFSLKQGKWQYKDATTNEWKDLTSDVAVSSVNSLKIVAE